MRKMRKKIIGQDLRDASHIDHDWIDVERLARIELTSEDPACPIEAALIPINKIGWRAAQPGEQSIRLLFEEPQRIKRIQLLFQEDQRARTHEFMLRWSPDNGQSYREIVRQQFNFSPPVVTRELENYSVDLAGVTLLELRIVPDISRGEARASMSELRIA